MKLTIKFSETCPIGLNLARRTLASLDFQKYGDGVMRIDKIDPISIAIDGERSIFLEEMSYTPANRVFSIIISFRNGDEVSKVFASIFEFQNGPTYFAFELPTKEFLELYFNI